nr:OadG family transporter subunit [uncultured Agathobaculum sp.]
MVQDPLSLLDALMVALSGFVIVFIMLAVLWGIIVVVSRVMAGVERRPAAAPASMPAPAPMAAPAPATAAPVAAAPQVVLTGITETEAACVMAIVSHETGIPLDQLVFKSIKAV